MQKSKRKEIVEELEDKLLSNLNELNFEKEDGHYFHYYKNMTDATYHIKIDVCGENVFELRIGADWNERIINVNHTNEVYNDIDSCVTEVKEHLYIVEKNTN